MARPLPAHETALGKACGFKAPRLVELDGVRLWFLEDEDGSGPLAPLNHCDERGEVVVIATSYAHVFEDGAIKRHGEVIGDVADLVEVRS